MLSVCSGKAQKNKVVMFLDDIDADKIEKLVKLAITLGKKDCDLNQKRAEEIRQTFHTEWQSSSKGE